MTHDDFIAKVAKRLEWSDKKISGIVENILEVVSAELKMNNPVVIDDFGTLKTDIQPEYILLNPKTKERHLMPPAVEVIFEPLFGNEEDSLLYPTFTPDEVLHNDVNSSFSQFEPTLLNEGVQFPGIPEIVVDDVEEGNATPELLHQQEEVVEEIESTVLPEIEQPAEEIEIPESAEPIEPIKQLEPVGQIEPVFPESPHRYSSSRRRVKSNKKTPSVWIPIAGGIAIIVASLFFFKGDGNR